MPSGGFKYLAEGYVDLAALELVQLPIPARANPLQGAGTTGRSPLKTRSISSAGVKEGFDDVRFVVGYVERQAPLLWILVQPVGQALFVAVTELDRANLGFAALVGGVNRVVGGEGSH